MCAINRGLALREMMFDLNVNGYNYLDKRTIEMFGGKGDWHLHELIKFVDPDLLDVCEIRNDFTKELVKKFPRSNVLNLDSLSYCQSEFTLSNSYELIVIDNPQGVYGGDNLYCEHFEAIIYALNAASDSVSIIFNINTSPFDLEKDLVWLHSRKNFYSSVGIDCIDGKGDLDVNNIEIFYRSIFNKNGYIVDKFRMYSRFSDHKKSVDYLHYGFISATRR
mgnify:CR=1 FL=1|jgi:hypothetical protein